MWEELLPKLVGGTIVDHDDPMLARRVITDYSLTDGYVAIKTATTEWGARRRLVGLSAGREPGTFDLSGPFGMGATVTLPSAKG